MTVDVVLTALLLEEKTQQQIAAESEGGGSMGPGSISYEGSSISSPGGRGETAEVEKRWTQAQEVPLPIDLKEAQKKAERLASFFF